MQSQVHADSEYVSCGVDCNGAEFSRALCVRKTCFASLGFKGILPGLPANFCTDKRLLVTGSDTMIGFCRVNAALSLAFCFLELLAE